MGRVIFISVFLIAVSGCKGFLDEDPKSLIGPAEFFTEASSAQSAVDAIYSHLDGAGVYANSTWLLNGMLSDNGVANTISPDINQLSDFTLRPDNTVVEDIWRQLYAAINTANFAIAGIPSAPLNPVEQIPLIAEARFYRGMFYYDLMRFFGEVPLITEPVLDVSQPFLVPRSSLDSVYALIVEDLDYARTYLPKSSGTGRPTDLVAAAMLAKTYAERKEYSKAFQLTRVIILSTKFQLLPDYRSNFLIGNKINSEVMLAAYLSPSSTGDINVNLLPDQYNGFSRVLPTAGLFDQFADADRRKAVTFIESVVNPDSSVTTIEPHIGKYWDATEEPLGGPTSVNIPILRYSEILLLHAELVNELNNGPTSEALFVINLVRQRAGLNNLGSMNKNAFREAVLAERRLELAWEGCRWHDLRRFGVLEEMVTAAKPGVAVSQMHYRLPVPAAEIQKNTLLSQNPGY